MTHEMFPPTRTTRIAVEFLTLWLVPGDEARLTAARHINEVINRSDTHVESVIVGHLNLAMLLLIMLAKERGATGENLLQRAGDILRELSRGLPE
jgi:hypothetical protein